MRRFLARLTNLFHPSRAEGELAREIDAHLALLQEDFERRGLSPEAARNTVRFTLGRPTTAQDIETLLNVMPAIVRRLRRSYIPYP